MGKLVLSSLLTILKSALVVVKFRAAVASVSATLRVPTDRDKFSLGGTTLTFKATDFEARDDKTYSVEITASRRTDTAFIGSKINHFICIFWRRNISRGNGKIRLYRYGKFLGSTITC
jgi:hypothetical protein